MGAPEGNKGYVAIAHLNEIQLCTLESLLFLSLCTIVRAGGATFRALWYLPKLP